MHRSIVALVSATTFITLPAFADVPHRASGWASQSSTLRTPGPLSGRFATAANGVTPPFAEGQPIPGWSGLLYDGDDRFTALPDNGYGSKANSSDYIIGVYRTEVEFKLVRIEFEQPLASFSPARGREGAPDERRCE